jgi:hypothetical protein
VSGEQKLGFVRSCLPPAIRRRRFGDVVVFWRFVCSRLPRSIRKTEGGGSEGAVALSTECNGVRADSVVLLQSMEEGAKVDFMECSEPRQEVLRLRRCVGELSSNFSESYFTVSSISENFSESVSNFSESYCCASEWIRLWICSMA